MQQRVGCSLHNKAGHAPLFFMGVGAHVLQFWDEATVRELFAEIQGAGLLTLGLYTLLLCQAALYAVVALVEIDLGVLVCLVAPAQSWASR